MTEYEAVREPSGGQNGVGLKASAWVPGYRNSCQVA